jgi:hypothetical protein
MTSMNSLTQVFQKVKQAGANIDVENLESALRSIITLHHFLNAP